MYYLIGIMIFLLFANFIYSFFAISAANARRLNLDEEETRKYYSVENKYYDYKDKKPGILFTGKEFDSIELPQSLAHELDFISGRIIDLLKSHDFHQQCITERKIQVTGIAEEVLELKKMMNSNNIFLMLLLKHMNLKYVEESTEVKVAHFEKIED